MTARAGRAVRHAADPDPAIRREPVSVGCPDGTSVSGNLVVPAKITAVFVMAHGAGAGMLHPFMEAVADGLAARGFATLRYQFPYMERGSTRPDRPAAAHAAVRAAVSTPPSCFRRRLCWRAASRSAAA